MDVLTARNINRWCGTAIGFWEVGKFDEATLAMFDGLANGLPTMRAGIAKIESAKDKIRKQFSH